MKKIPQQLKVIIIAAIILSALFTFMIINFGFRAW